LITVTTPTCEECDGQIVLVDYEWACSKCGLVSDFLYTPEYDETPPVIVETTPFKVRRGHRTRGLPKCICGNRTYTFTREKDRIAAKCSNYRCRYVRHYYWKTGQWTTVESRKKIPEKNQILDREGSYRPRNAWDLSMDYGPAYPEDRDVSARDIADEIRLKALGEAIRKQ
jgi:hypothetical protein